MSLVIILLAILIRFYFAKSKAEKFFLFTAIGATTFVGQLVATRLIMAITLSVLGLSADFFVVVRI